MSSTQRTQVSRAQKISTVVDPYPITHDYTVSRAQKISTVVDNLMAGGGIEVSRAQKISTVVDKIWDFDRATGFTRSKNFYCCRLVFQLVCCIRFTRSKNFYCCR